ncbi:MAG: porin family protein [Saprospiraceae bacterium]|nr:porin family protein [Saprospiraceae bacterium]
MKKTLTLKLIGMLVILMTSLSAIHAQDDSGDDYNAKARFGVRGGVIIANQTFENGSLDDDSKSKFGADIAVLVNIPIGTGFFMVQPELHWLQKGSVIADINGDDITNTFNYLELPVLLRLNFGNEAKIFAIGGPSLGYLLSGKSGDFDIDKDLYEDLEWGVHLGVGIGLGALEIDVRYMAGLSDISAVDGNLSEVKNNAFGAGVTLKF